MADEIVEETDVKDVEGTETDETTDEEVDEFILDLGDVDKTEEEVQVKEKDLKDKETGAEKTAEINELKDAVKQLTDDNKKLHNQFNFELRKDKKAKETNAPSDDSETLSDQQIQDILREHEGDPSTMLNVVKYVVDQKMKGVKSDTLDAAEIGRTKKQYDQQIDAIPDLADPSSQLSRDVDDVVKEMNLGQHPIGKYLALSVVAHQRMPKIVENAVVKAKKDALLEKADAHRKSAINGNKLLSGKTAGKKSSKGVHPSFSENVKQFGMNKQQSKIYQAMLGNKATSITPDTGEED